MPVNDHKTAFFNSIADYSMNTGIIATDTGVDVSAYTSDTMVGNTIIASSAINGPYVISPIGGGILGGTTNYNYIHTPDWQNKRMDVRDNGKIPVDIWAIMYNNGVIDD